jgi:hypothetical protein
MSFPLYDNLSADLPEVDLTNKEKDFVVKQMKKFDSTIHERIYALIRCHQLQNSRDVSLIPYGGKVTKQTGNNGSSSASNVSFDLDKFDVALKHIIHKLCLIEAQQQALK